MSLYNGSLGQLDDFVRKLNAQGGPREQDYLELVWRCAEVLYAWDFDQIRAEIRDIFHPYTDLETGTIMSRIFHQPEGYAGDYKTMDRLHKETVTAFSATARRWDQLVLAQPSAGAVRERKTFLEKKFMTWLDRGTVKTFLDVASGSGIALHALEDARKHLFLEGNRRYDTQIEYHCIDQDTRALNFSRSMYDNEFHPQLFVSWHEAAGNVVHYRFKRNYDYAWSAGLFDYFSDRMFIHMGVKLLRQTNHELIVGAVGPYHSSAPLMQILGWDIYLRSAEELYWLGEQIVNKYHDTIPHEAPNVNWYVSQDNYGVQKYLIFQK